MCGIVAGQAHLQLVIMHPDVGAEAFASGCNGLRKGVGLRVGVRKRAGILRVAVAETRRHCRAWEDLKRRRQRAKTLECSPKISWLDNGLEGETMTAI